jgi:hypothetical protein
MKSIIVLAAAVLLAAGCGSTQRAENERPELTQRQRDSVLARSGLPGSRTVGMALHQSDRAALRSSDLDSLSAR